MESKKVHLHPSAFVNYAIEKPSRDGVLILVKDCKRIKEFNDTLNYSLIMDALRSGAVIATYKDSRIHHHIDETIDFNREMKSLKDDLVELVNKKIKRNVPVKIEDVDKLSFYIIRNS